MVVLQMGQCDLGNMMDTWFGILLMQTCKKDPIIAPETKMKKKRILGCCCIDIIMVSFEKLVSSIL